MLKSLWVMANSNNTTASAPGDPVLIGGICNPEERLWWVFFLGSIITFIAGLILVLLSQLITILHKKARSRNNHLKQVADSKPLTQQNHHHSEPKSQDDIGCITAAKDWAGELISGQTNSGRILVSVSLNFFTFSFCVYWQLVNSRNC